jgi:P4 family phage/plasmid primase-like protien
MSDQKQSPGRDDRGSASAAADFDATNHTGPSPARLFCNTVFGDRVGVVHLAQGIDPYVTDSGKYEFKHWVPSTYEWPAEAARLEQDIARAALDVDVYIDPYLMHDKQRTPGATVARPLLHADVDGGGLDLDKVREIGGFVVASGSEGNGHVYVLLSRSVPAHWHKILERVLVAYLGADPSKITTNDVLRPPGTLNYKPTVFMPGSDPAPVEFLIEPDTATPMDPHALAAIIGASLPSPDLPEVTVTPTADQRCAVEEVSVTDSAELVELAVEIVRDDLKVRKSSGGVDRSEDLCRVVNLCARQGLTKPQARWLIRKLRADLAAKLDEVRRDEVAVLYDSYHTFISAKRAEREAERRSQEEFFDASTKPTRGGGRPAVDMTDIGNANLLMDKAIGGYRFCPDMGRWLGWTARRWRYLADGGEIHSLAETVVTDLPRGNRNGDDLERAQARHRARSNSRRGLADMVAILQQRNDIRVTVDQLDAEPYELNTRSGVVDLRTGAVGPSNPERFHTKLTGVGVDFHMPAPRWAAFLRDTFGGDTALIEYVQKLVGLAAIGEVLHHVLPFLFGGGQNGKSVLIDVLTAVFGDYAVTAPANFLLAGRDKHETEIARLHGARFVPCAEVNKGSNFDEAKLKALTGGDMLTGRFMRGDFFDFRPTHSLWLMGNHQPRVTGGGTSFWRRMVVIPFLYTVPQDKRVEGLAKLLVSTEGAGILAWIVRGSQKALTDGLQEPEAVKAATEAYREQESPVERFVADCLDRTTASRTKAAIVYGSYENWCGINGEDKLTSAGLGRELASQGINGTRSHGVRYYSVTVDPNWIPTWAKP